MIVFRYKQTNFVPNTQAYKGLTGGGLVGWGLHRTQQSSLGTSRLMCYTLLLYYIIFSYFGEVFLLTTVGITSPTDFIQSSNFFSLKSHVFLYINSFSNYTLTQFSLVVQSLFIFSTVWLLTLNVQNSYMHLR